MTSETKANYPHVEPKPYEGLWRDIGLFGITGWYGQPYGGGEAATAFSGHFKLDPQYNSIEGLLIDWIGQAVIEGEMVDKELIFMKYYFQNRSFNPPIKYTLTSDGQKWQGHYKLRSGLTGLVECTTTLVENNAYGIVIGAERESIPQMIHEARRQFPINLAEDYGL